MGIRHKKAPSAATLRALDNVETTKDQNVMNNTSAISEVSQQGATAQIFQFRQAQQVRAVLIDGNPWFYAMDVCAAVSLSDTNKALIGLDEDEKREHEQYSGSGRKPILINESGLYSLILRSRKPEAKAFKKWVTSEVLPSIRKTGAYIHRSAMRPSLTKEHWRAASDAMYALTSSWVFSERERGWIFNNMRVVFQVARVEDIPDDQYETLMQLIKSKEQSVSDFLGFVMEAREWFAKEVLGSGQPWTPSIKGKLSRKMKRQVILPPKVDWIALAAEVESASAMSASA